jgi:hypothetical protein
MKWKVYCGLFDWAVTVEADTEADAMQQGRSEFIEATRTGEFFARPAGESAPETTGEQP